MSKSRAQLEANKQKLREILTSDHSSWSRECILPYPTKFERSIDLLERAARLAASSHAGIEGARRLIRDMDDHEMRSWYDDLAQNSGKVRLELLDRSPVVPRSQIRLKRPTMKRQLSIIETQGFHCRYCGIRIVPNHVLVGLQELVGYSTLPNRSRKRGKTKNTDIHGIWLMTRATVDHVDPLSHGSSDADDDDNLVACCWSCNYGKSKFTTTDLMIDDPRDREPKMTAWKGLTDVLSASRHP